MRLGTIKQMISPRRAARSGQLPATVVRPWHVDMRQLKIVPPVTNMATKWNQTDVEQGSFGFNVRFHTV
jgi:hypothetical protein